MVLFVNGCVRETSRTLELAEFVLSGINDKIERVDIFDEDFEGLDNKKLQERMNLLKSQLLNHASFEKARQFSSADTIVVAAPYWDLLFPARLRAYFEEITVSGITFRYSEEGKPQGLCKAKKLIFITTAGGLITANFGYDYIKALSKTFYGIENVYLVKAESLDIIGADENSIMENAKADIKNNIHSLFNKQ